jgi:multiple sugar transport system substrate-binding protein
MKRLFVEMKRQTLFQRGFKMANYLKMKKLSCLGLTFICFFSLLVFFIVDDSNAAIELTAITQEGGMGPPAKLAIDIANKRYEGQIHVNTVSIPWAVQFEKTMAEFVAKSKTYDIIPIWTQWLGATTRYMEDLTPYVKKAGFNLDVFPSGLVKMAAWKGKLIGLPFRTGILSLFYYRKDLFAKYGLKVPETMEQYYRNAEIITRKEQGVYGGCLMSGGNPYIYEDFVVWFFAQGGRLLNEEQNQVVPFEGKDGKLAIEMLRMWKKLHDQKLLPPAHTSWGIYDVLTAMQQNIVAQANAFSPRVLLVEDPKVSKTVGKWGFSPIFPGKEGKIGPRADAGGTWTFGINPLVSQERKEAAFKVIQVMVSEEAQKRAALEKANGPTLKSIYKNPEYLKANPAAPAILQGLETFYSLVCPENARMIDIISDEGGKAIIGAKTPEAAAKSIWDRTRELFKK